MKSLWKVDKTMCTIVLSLFSGGVSILLYPNTINPKIHNREKDSSTYFDSRIPGGMPEAAVETATAGSNTRKKHLQRVYK